MTAMKRCRTCGVEKPATLEFFHYNHTYADRLRADCKECIKEYRREYRMKNLEREKNQQKRHYHTNQERESKRIRVWQRNNRHKTYLRDKRRLDRLNELPCTFTPEDESNALDYFNGCCAICGRPLRDLFGERTISMDHWIPISNPDCPGTVPTNLVPMCHGIDGCNNKKNARDPEEWLVSEYGTKKAREILKRIEDFFSQIRRDRLLSG